MDKKKDLFKQSELYALFKTKQNKNRVIPLLETANQNLQKEEPCRPTLLKTLDMQSPIKSQASLPLGAFFRDVRKYFTAVVDYMLSKFP